MQGITQLKGEVPRDEGATFAVQEHNPPCQSPKPLFAAQFQITTNHMITKVVMPVGRPGLVAI